MESNLLIEILIIFAILAGGFTLLGILAELYVAWGERFTPRK